MASPRKPLTRLVRNRDAREELAISRVTFWRVWHAVFTDPRGVAERRPGCERKVLADELSIAVERGRNAVLLHRRLMGRV